MSLFTGISFFNLQYDSDAQLFLTNAGITDAVISDSINTLVLALKANNLWTKMYAVYPFVGGTENTHKYNLKNPAGTTSSFTLGFSGGFVHSSGGVRPGGTNSFADTYAIGSDFTNNDTHVSYYSRDNIFGTHTEFGIEASTGESSTNNRVVLHSSYSDFSTYSDQYNYGTARLQYVGGPVSDDGNAFFIGTRTTSGIHRLYKNGSQIGSTNTGTAGDVTTIARTMYMFALRKWNDTINDRTLKQCGFASFGAGLTATDCLNLYNIVRNFSIGLSRNNLGVCQGNLISTTNLRLYQKFNNFTRDCSGRGVPTVATNLDYSLGPHIDQGYAGSWRVAADGSGTGSQVYVENTNLAMPGAGVSFSVAMWAYVKNLPGTNKFMGLSGKYQTGSPSGGWDFRFYNNTGTQTLQFLVSNSSNAAGNRDSIATFTFSFGNEITTQTWVHLAGVYDGTKCYIYKNGEIIATASGDCTSILNTTRRLTIGYNDLNTSPNNQIRYFDGLIDDYALFYRGLTQGEIQTLANSSCPLSTNPTVDYGRFAAIRNSGVSQRAQWSNDGITWNLATTPNSLSYFYMDFNPTAGMWVAAASDASSANIMTSTNSVTWTSRSKPDATASRGLSWCPAYGRWLMAATTKVFSSLDGINWTIAYTFSTGNCQTLEPVYAETSKGNVWAVCSSVTTGTGNLKIVSTTDGISFTESNVTSATDFKPADGRAINYSPSNDLYWMIHQDTPQRISISATISSGWTSYTASLPNANVLRVGIDTNSSLLVSPWYANSGTVSNIAEYSSTGQSGSWTASTIANGSYQIYDAEWAQEIGTWFLASFNSTTGYSSTDGITWTSRTQAGSNMTRVVWGAGVRTNGYKQGSFIT